MKKIIGLLIAVSVVLALSACNAAGGVTSAAKIGVSTPGNGEVSLAMQMALGTLKLESTPYAVSADQAAELIPLWKAALSLGKSDTAAAEEMNGLVKQIQKSLSAEQIQAIQELGLTSQNLPAITQELGIDLGVGAAPPAGNSTSSASANASSGGMAGGPPPDASGGMPGGEPGGGPGPQTAQSSQTTSSSSVNFLGLNQTLLDKVIQLLESKVQ